MSNCPIYHYRPDRVLLDFRQFLPDEKPGQAVWITDPELHMLRNMCEYLDRRDTWVFRYKEGSYDGPDDADWDMIQGLVADLEEKLMPNNVVAWGYTDRWLEDLGGIKVGDGNYAGTSTAVPAGFVYVIQALYGRNDSRVPAQIGLYVSSGGINQPVYVKLLPAQSEAVIWTGDIVLKVGDSVLVYVVGCLDGDVIYAGARGYKMAVPS